MSIEPWVPVFYESAGFGIQEWVTIGVGIGGALLGALVGGLISWTIARSDREALQSVEEEARLATQRAQLIRAQFQVSLILTDVEATLRSIDESLVLANKGGMTGQPLFMRMMPVIGAMATPTLQLDDIAPLIVARENALVQAYLEAHAKHDVLVQAMARFDQEKAALNERVSPFMRSINGVSVLEMNAERAASLKPFFDAADSLATSIRDMAKEVRILAREATFGIGPAAVRIFEDDKFPVLEPRDDET